MLLLATDQENCPKRIKGKKKKKKRLREPTTFLFSLFILF
jgi:hypothetical protein